MKIVNRRRRAESPVDTLLRTLDAISTGTLSNAARVAKRIRDAGEVPDGIIADLATAATGPGGGSWITADPLLAALNRYSVASGGTDWSAVPFEEQRQRQAQETISERIAAAYEREAERAEAARVRSLLGR